jgi:hypothetical protein
MYPGGELARVVRRLVILSFYQCTPLPVLARHWRGTRGRLAMMTFPHLGELAQASEIQVQRVYALLRLCHAQTFVVLTKTRGWVVDHTRVTGMTRDGWKKACL